MRISLSAVFSKRRWASKSKHRRSLVSNHKQFRTPPQQLSSPPWRALASLLNHKLNKGEKKDLAENLQSLGGYTPFKYGGESTKNSTSVEIVEALRLGDRSKASNLLSDLGQTSDSLRPDDFVDILKLCAKLPDSLFAVKTWEIMMEKDVNLDDICFEYMVQALCEGYYLDEALNLMTFCGETHGIYPSQSAYTNFLKTCAKRKTTVQAKKCLELMERQMVGKSESMYLPLLKLAVWQRKLSAVSKLWKEFIKCYSLSIYSLRQFILAFKLLRDVNSAHEALIHMVNLACAGERTFYKNPISSKLDIPIPLIGGLNTEYNEAKSIKMTRSGHEGLLVTMLLRRSFNDVIHTYASTRNCDLAEQLFLQMENFGLRPSSNTYDGYIRAVVYGRGPSAAIEVLKVMQQRNLKPSDLTLATISIGYSEALELDLAEAFLDEITEFLAPLPFNAFLIACDTLDEPERAVRIFSKMKQSKILPDITTYELLFSLFGNVNAPYEEGNMFSQVDVSRRISAIEMDMAKNRVQHSHVSIKNLLKALGDEGMIRELMHYLRVAENLFHRSNSYLGISLYNAALHSLVEAKECSVAVEMFKHMKASGRTLTAATYDIMINCCSLIGCFKSASSLVSMMIRDGSFPDTATYTSLMKILVNSEEYGEALHLLCLASSQGIKRDAFFYNSFLRGACDKGLIDVLELVVENMHRDNIKPDPWTCGHVFNAYVNCGFLNTGIEALQVLSLRMIGDIPVEEQRKHYEDLIVREDVDVGLLVKEYLDDLEGVLVSALLNLRWCAILGFPVSSWSPNQSPWALRLSSNYDAGRTV